MHHSSRGGAFLSLGVTDGCVDDNEHLLFRRAPALPVSFTITSFGDEARARPALSHPDACTKLCSSRSHPTLPPSRLVCLARTPRLPSHPPARSARIAQARPRLRLPARTKLVLMGEASPFSPAPPTRQRDGLLVDSLRPLAAGFNRLECVEEGEEDTKGLGGDEQVALDGKVENAAALAATYDLAQRSTSHIQQRHVVIHVALQ
ncbi:hypothetical protein K438DRAFT_2032692 [Mycena galopus ATCC 62051]|nr:hypothetical protein K438DRAFT_2032692 [Mycena galopus ATCC 62051]